MAMREESAPKRPQGSCDAFSDEAAMSAEFRRLLRSMTQDELRLYRRAVARSTGRLRSRSDGA